MKIHHRVPIWTPKPEPISERYQSEVDSATSRLERRYRRAQAALASALRRAEKTALKRGAKPSKDHRDLLRLIEVRRAELREIEALMIPYAYQSRESHLRKVRHETGNGTVNLGGYARSDLPEGRAV